MEKTGHAYSDKCRDFVTAKKKGKGSKSKTFKRKGQQLEEARVEQFDTKTEPGMLSSV